MSYFTISQWEATEWTPAMEAIARDTFAPLIKSCGAASVDMVRTGELRFAVVTKYENEATAAEAAKKIAEIRGKASTELPLWMVSEIKGATFVSA